MSRSLEVFNEIYKPYKITRKNNAYILNTMDGDYVVKENPHINYQELYKYLKSRNFNYLPIMSIDSRDDLLVLEYQEDISIDQEQKALDLISVVALLHNKTSYFKSITNDKYKEIYENINNNILSLTNKYEDYFAKFLTEEYLVPSHYLFLRNYSLIFKANQYAKDKLDEWYSMIKDKNKERVALIHNNLRLDHFLKNSEEYLISWDNYTIDTPILDLYHFYQNEWMNISFNEVFSLYNESFTLHPEEKALLDILISLPLNIDFKATEMENCQKVRELINYLNSSSKIVFNN